MAFIHSNKKKWLTIIATFFVIHLAGSIGSILTRNIWMYALEISAIFVFGIFVYNMLKEKESYAIDLVKEIKKHKETYEELEANRVKLQNVFDSIDIAIWSHNLQTNKLLITSGIEKLYGYPLQAFYDDVNLWRKVIHPEDIRIMKQRASDIVKGLTTTSEYRILRPDGDIRWIQDRGIPFLNDKGELVDFNSILIDITERKHAELTINQMAYFDELTGLPNRNGFMDAIEQKMKEVDRKQGNLALFFLDLDCFNVLNDTLGHSFGDLLLQEVAELLKNTIPQKDQVFRRGGDEFLILLEYKDETEVTAVAEEIIYSFTKPFMLSGKEVFTTPSIGISLYPGNGSDSDTLLKRADGALYQAKDRGRNTYQFFTEQHDGKIERRLNLEHGLRKALEKNELFLVYQPQVRFHTKQITGVEALLRWNKGSEGMISPGEFIPIAEDTGMILLIGEWVLKNACLQGYKWHQNGFDDLLISVNISVRQLLEESFVLRVENILNETHFPASSLELEITESTTMESMEETLPVLNRLREMGIRISIDDFGTGYSSLTYLRQLPVDTLKIDKMFIDDILRDPKAGAIVKTIIDMGHNLSFHVIAEGIESCNQIDFLLEQGCLFGQGYHLFKPLKPDELEEHLQVNMVVN
ncbi:putative bifunctional diguanylate cyclase/phosphodiesterase [Fictibacillus phosphorivorans]|uniref:putative bifunctional diguanylate cyclase/phosphodiesterase n=1 Tax=Fictibacillus phosphorivorans TaxID=1221500 RepID=UPI00203BA39E|nr:GGDEF domain-containing phosphodiesterase [Fictibacillus phosphorivorans]MCM3718008.1 EAL domain-containing protein [Fictibacillus phosphorivorans]MCM3775457.1 EAL domain-containing protein [Fictibacillus phosphorivorans]